MGSLANWSALAGAAKGFDIGVQRMREDKAAEMQKLHDERMVKLEHGFALERQREQNKFLKDEGILNRRSDYDLTKLREEGANLRTTEQITSNENISKAEIEADDKRLDKQLIAQRIENMKKRVHDAQQGQSDRLSREYIAKLNHASALLLQDRELTWEELKLISNNTHDMNKFMAQAAQDNFRMMVEQAYETGRLNLRLASDERISEAEIEQQNLDRIHDLDVLDQEHMRDKAMLLIKQAYRMGENEKDRTSTEFMNLLDNATDLEIAYLNLFGFSGGVQQDNAEETDPANQHTYIQDGTLGVTITPKIGGIAWDTRQDGPNVYRARLGRRGQQEVDAVLNDDAGEATAILERYKARREEVRDNPDAQPITVQEIANMMDDIRVLTDGNGMYRVLLQAYRMKAVPSDVEI